MLGIHDPDRGPAYVGEYQPPHVVLLCVVSNIQHATVAPGSPRA
jgi:hypothetical protein